MPLKNLITKYDMNVTGVIHVGAHYGEEVSDYISNQIFNMVLFEPLKENYKILADNIEKLTNNISDVNISMFNYALGSTESNNVMYVSSNEKQSSSILKPKQHLIQHPNVFFLETEDVFTRRLDTFDTYNYNFLNMDVQGYELEVLKGAEKTLEKIDYVYCEVNRAEVYENNAFIEDIDDYLSSYGMIRVETDWAGGTWGDAFYTKKNEGK